ncbi:MAG TPA: hypothetical protein VEP90_01225 [Methylomirabilota bacterium]|nr:hypothetical protein [Methylomirabilota bacterium]
MADDQITKIQIYCSALYNLMDENSELLPIQDGEARIWKGYVTQACGLVEIPEGVRNRVVKRLGDVGSIQVVEQGRRNNPSVIALFYPPTDEVWRAFQDETLQTDLLTNRPDPAMMSQQIRDIREQMGGVNIPDALKNHEERLNSLLIRVRKLEERAVSKD